MKITRRCERAKSLEKVKREEFTIKRIAEMEKFPELLLDLDDMLEILEKKNKCQERAFILKKYNVDLIGKLTTDQLRDEIDRLMCLCARTQN